MKRLHLTIVGIYVVYVALMIKAIAAGLSADIAANMIVIPIYIAVIIMCIKLVRDIRRLERGNRE
jgi:hypothetical protein